MPFDVWHDRATFHFLTEPADQDTYLEVLKRTLVPGGRCHHRPLWPGRANELQWIARYLL